MERKSATIPSVLFVGCLSFLWIVIFCFSYAAAAPPTICFESPIGQPFYYPGESIYVKYESPDYGDDPEHTQIFALNFSYRWEGDTTSYFVHTADPNAFKSGGFFWNAPSVNPVQTLLTVVADYTNEEGEILSEWESDVVRILPGGEPALHIFNPISMVSPTQSSQPPCYFYHRVVEGGANTFVAWKIMGCENVTHPNYLELMYTTNGTAYTQFDTITDPCNVTAGQWWSVPEVDTTAAKLRIKWWENIPKVGLQLVTSTTSRYPFEITTGDIPHPPVAIAGDDKTVDANQRVRLNGCDSYDPDPEDTLTYEWVQVDAMRAAYPAHLSCTACCSPDIQTPCVNSEITMRFSLSVSDGIFPPATDEISIRVLPSEDDPDGDCVDSENDNCPTVANPGQEDRDGDDVGDRCDICPDDHDPGQQNFDGDGLGDDCDPCPSDGENDADGDGYCANDDNCPHRYNPGQEDWDNDGEGDACDWDDGLKGPFEYGADCGWDAPNPCSTGSCQRLIYNGDSDSKIDVVLIPAEDYWVSYPWEGSALYMAIEDGMADFFNSYLADPTMGSETNRTKYNIWYPRNTIAGLRVDGDRGCQWDDGDWKDDCPDGDIAYIIHVTECRNYSRGDTFSSTAGNFGTLLHESGHDLFDLGDEYDDYNPDDEDNSCTTHYHEVRNRTRSNIWRLKSRCENNTSLDEDDCYKFTTCQADWYKAQRGPSIMECTCPGYPAGICDWGDDALRAVEHVLDDYDSSSSLMAAADGDEGDRKGLLADFYYDGSTVTMTGIHAVNGGGPERVVERGEGLRMIVEDSRGTILHTFTIPDPRYKDFDSPPGGEWLSEVAFSEVIPFYVEANTLRVSDIVSGTSLGVFDISSAVATLCAEFPDHSPCRCEGDLEEDKDVDGKDLSIFAEAYQSGNTLADLNRDQAVNREDVEIFAGKFGRTVCPDMDLPPCNDGNPCTRDYYDPVAETCVYRSMQCYDGSPCTMDICDPQTGGCLYIPKDCDDDVPCTVDTCDPVSGECAHTPLDCDDENACTNDFCNEQTGQCVHKTLLCNDGNYCTTDQCDPRVGCYYLERDCDDGENCTIDSCDPETGACIHTYNSNCQACCKSLQCTDMTALACNSVGGTPMGPGTKCGTTTCPK